MSEITYANYIAVPDLLKLQKLRSRDHVPMAKVSEHFFIVTHQTSELWLAQVLLDLDESILAMSERRYVDAEECLHRSAVVLDVMTSNLEALATMPPSRFACFRGELGTASGAQSRQFAELDRRLGLGRGGNSPLLDALMSSCEREGMTPRELLRAGNADHPELAKLVLAMLDVSRKVWKWKATHVELVARMLGHQNRGTGGSAGLRYLVGRLDMPFEVLWEAVSGVHRDALIGTPGR
jgi:tryptophan 2,3-dioxygenase